MSLPVEITDYIRAEVARQRVRSVSYGGVVSIVSSRYISVTMDGSGAPAVVRLLGDATANPDERAVLILVDDEWVCVGTTTPHPVPPIPGFDFHKVESLSGSVNGSSYVDFADYGSRTFTKASEDYRTMVRFEGTLYVNTADSTAIQFGVRVDSTDHDVLEIAATNGLFLSHTPWSMTEEITGLSVGNHTFKPRWKRTAGTGTGIVDGGDTFAMTVWEVPV